MPAPSLLARAVLPARRLPLPPLPTGLVPVGSTFGFVGDGIMSQAACPGTRNMGDWFLELMGLRLQPVPVWNLAQSGTVMARTVGSNANVWINPHAVDALAAQKPDVAIFGSCGHNDGLKAADPDTNAVYLGDWKDALTRHVAANPQALLIPVMGTWPSLQGTELPAIRAKVWARQQAHVASFADPRLLWIDVSAIDPSAVNDSTDSTRVHPDLDGGQQGGLLLHAAISPRVAAATPAQVQAMIDAGSYPLMGTQVDGDRMLVGTGGTATTGMQAGSAIATSKLVSNATGGTVSAAMVSAGGYNKVVVSLSGTANTDGNVLVQDKVNLAVMATPGQHVVTGFGVRVPIGLNRLGSDWGNFGGGMSGAASATDAVADNPTTTALDTIWVTVPQPVFGTATPAVKRSLNLRYKAGSALSGSLELYQPFAWVVRDRLRHAPVYLGDVKPAGTGGPPTAVAARLRPTGTVSAAAGGTVRVEPGKWAPHGLTEADFLQRRLYKGTAANTGLGSGTLLATLSGATWTHAVPAGAVVAGDLLYVEVDCATGVGGTVTARSTLSVTTT
jgi:hypothetical protein